MTFPFENERRESASTVDDFFTLDVSSSLPVSSTSSSIPSTYCTGGNDGSGINVNVNFKLYLNAKNQSAGMSGISDSPTDLSVAPAGVSSIIPIDPPVTLPTSTSSTNKHRAMTSQQRRNSYRFVSEVLGGSCASQDFAIDLQTVVNELSNAMEERVSPNILEGETNSWDVKNTNDTTPIIEDNSNEFGVSLLNEMILPAVTDEHKSPDINSSLYNTVTDCFHGKDSSPVNHLLATPMVKSEHAYNALKACCFADDITNVQIKSEPIDTMPTQTSALRPTILPLSNITTPANVPHTPTNMIHASLHIPQSSAPLSCPDFHTMSMLVNEDSNMSCFSLPRLPTDTMITPSPSASNHHNLGLTYPVENSHTLTDKAEPSHFSDVRICGEYLSKPLVMDTGLKSYVDRIKQEPHLFVNPERNSLRSSLMVLPLTPPGSQPTSPSMQPLIHTTTQINTPTSVLSTSPSYVLTPSILTLPRGSVTLTVSPPSPSVVKPLVSILPAPKKEPLAEPGVCFRHRTGPKITAYNTHPGCTTIKYNRKNNPDLEKRRIHFCNFPGMYYLFYFQKEVHYLE